jgi:cyclase
MPKPRIIARLDIKTHNVVKGIRFEGLRVMGKPEELATRYYEQGADELLYIDTVASLYGRNNLTDVVQQAASHIFIPLTVGGGIRSVGDAQALLRSGADKIAINTAAVREPALLNEISAVLGSQAVVASLQVKRIGAGQWEIYVDNGREHTGIDALDWARQVEQRGAGEILVTSVDRDGTGQGFDVEIIDRIARLVSIPVIAAGGAKDPGSVVDILRNSAADAVAVGSMLHYKRYTVGDIKTALAAANIAAACH